MAVAILSHPVADFKKWKTFYDADAERRAGAGIREISVGQDVKDPNMAYMIYELDNTDILDQMMADPNLAEIMKQAGVTGPPTVVILQ